MRKPICRTTLHIPYPPTCLTRWGCYGSGAVRNLCFSCLKCHWICCIRRHSQSVAMADIDRRFAAGHRFCLFMLQPLSFPFRNMVAATTNRRGIQPDHCLQAARNVGASICAFVKKPADYGYFIFPVSIRRR